MKATLNLSNGLLGLCFISRNNKYSVYFSSLQLDVIANIFINQLTEARHRGAFEMAYAGFSKLCHCLWTSSHAELHQKPSVWVQELLDSLQSTSLTTLLSFTRRSAGLPFYLQVS